MKLSFNKKQNKYIFLFSSIITPEDTTWQNWLLLHSIHHSMRKLWLSYKDANVEFSLHSVVLMQTKSLVVQIRPQMFLVTSQPQKFLVTPTISHQLHHVFPHLACPPCFQSTIQPVAQNLSLICKLFSYVEMVYLEFNWIYDTSCSDWIQHIAHETAICHNPPIHNFKGDRKNKTDP